MRMFQLNPVLFLFAVVTSVSLVACGGDNGNGNDTPPEDNEAPAISLTAPAENDIFIRGVNAIQLSGELTDNQELDTCIISLSNELKSASSGLKSTNVDNGDNGDDVVTSIDDPIPFEPNAVGFSLSGKSHSFSNESVFGTIPEDATEGNYTLNIEVRDASGNSVNQDIVISISAQ
ncbi:DUF4625 domain-containing protein [Marinilabilia sp.]